MKFAFIIFLSLFLNGAEQDFEFIHTERHTLGIYKERTASASAGDIDNDGDIDLAVANGRHWPGQNRIFINNNPRNHSIIYVISSNINSKYVLIYI